MSYLVNIPIGDFRHGIHAGFVISTNKTPEEFKNALRVHSRKTGVNLYELFCSEPYLTGEDEEILDAAGINFAHIEDKWNVQPDEFFLLFMQVMQKVMPDLMWQELDIKMVDTVQIGLGMFP